MKSISEGLKIIWGILLLGAYVVIVGIYMSAMVP